MGAGRRLTQRPFQYVNSFDQIITFADQMALHPDLDTDPSFTATNVLDNMKASATAGVLNPNAEAFLDSDGVFKVVLIPETTGKFQSRTFYALSPVVRIPNRSELPEFNQGHFNLAPSLVAELDFDSPGSATQHPQDTGRAVWAVGLNFKSGNETDRGDGDKIRIGPTCQFIDDGGVRFHNTDYSTPQKIVFDATYEDYVKNNVPFKLRLSMTRSLSAVEINASLLIDNILIASASITPDPQGPPLDLTNIAQPGSEHITAIGVGIGHLGKSADGNPVTSGTVSVRLRSFSLNYGQ